MAAGDRARVMMRELESGASGGGSPGELVGVVMLSPEQDVGLDALSVCTKDDERKTGPDQCSSGILPGRYLSDGASHGVCCHPRTSPRRARPALLSVRVVCTDARERTDSRRKRPPPYLPMEKTYSSTGWPSSKVDYTGSSANRGCSGGDVARGCRTGSHAGQLPRNQGGGCHSFLPRDSPGVLPALSLADARAKTTEELGSTRGSQSQSRRLKIKNKLTQTTPIRPMAKGYPKLQLNSGMCLKFMP